jgi:WD40 repeat protein
MLLTKLKILGLLFVAVCLLGVAGLLARPALAGKSGAGDARDKPTSRSSKPQGDHKARADRYGDPLPAGAVARLGTVRFRHNSTCVAYSPNGKILASGGADNQIRLFDASTGKEIRRLKGHQPKDYDPPFNPRSPFDALVNAVAAGNVTSLAFAPDNKLLASAGWDDMVRLWDVDTGTEVRKIVAHKAMVATVVFSPNGKFLASRGGIDGIVRLWDPRTGNEIRHFEGLTKVNPWHFNREAGLVFSPDSKTLAAGDAKVIRFWDVASGKARDSWPAHLACVSLAYSKKGDLLASGGIDGKDKNSIRLWDVSKARELRRCKLPKDEPPIHLAFSPKADRLAAVVEEYDLLVFDVATGNVVHRLSHYWPSRVAFAPNGKTLASARGQTVRLWDQATGKERFQEFKGHQAGVVAVAFSPNGKLVASGGDHIRLWEAATGKPIRLIQVKGGVAALAFDPKGGKLASAGRDPVVHVWDVDSGKEIATLKGLKHMLCGLAFSPNGKMVAAGDVQSTIHIWDAAQGTTLHKIDMESMTEALSLAFSPDNRTLACAGAWNDSSFLPGTINIQGIKTTRKVGYYVLHWDVRTGKEVRRFGGLTDKIKSLAFSPKGKILAAASRDGKVCLWDADTGKERLYIVAHPGAVDAEFTTSPFLVFSPDGKLLASASTDKTIRFWEVDTAREYGRIKSPDGGFNAIAFDRTGKRLASASSDSTVTIWDWAAAVKAKEPNKPTVIYLK